MNTDVGTESAVHRLVECFNGKSVSALAELRDGELTINSAFLGDDRRSNALVNEGIGRLVAACHSRFPGIQFQCDSVAKSNDGFTSQWTGRWRPEDQLGQALAIPCTCRVKYAGRFMRELWFTVDEYSILLQLGKVCSAPGQALGHSASVNQLAAESLKEAIVSGNSTCDRLGQAVEMHVNIETYRDIGKSVDIEAYRLDGAGQIVHLLAYVRNRFGRPVELSFKKGISQGHTTTFRGAIRARLGGAETQRYDIVCGFVSPGDEVSECWVKISPPPTLMECLT